MHKRRLKKSVIILFFLICLVGLIYSVFKIFIWKSSIDRNSNMKQQLEESVTIVDDDDINKKFIVDFDSLKNQNSDTVAYLKVNNTDISYVVVRGNDNDYYLNHSFDREYSVAGWVFADYKNKFDGTDKNMVIYAHSMKDGSMFGSLYEVFSSEWLSNEENYDIIFITPDENSVYKVFSIYTVRAEDYYITTSFSSNNEFSTFIDVILERSQKDFNVDVTKDDYILTLSTCTSNSNNRLVVHAKKIMLDD